MILSIKLAPLGHQVGSMSFPREAVGGDQRNPWLLLR